LAAVPRITRARLPWRLRSQYLLSVIYWLSGWTILIYMTFPVLRILFGIQPLADLSASEFLLHFAPYFLIALTTAALAGAGSYTYSALALASTSFWLFIVASVLTVARRRGSFKVTPKQGSGKRQPRAVAPALAGDRARRRFDLGARALARLRDLQQRRLRPVARDDPAHGGMACPAPAAPVTRAGARSHGRRGRLMGPATWTAALALGLTITIAGCGSPPDDREVAAPGAAATASDRRATDAAYAFLDTYTMDGGRIARLDEGADTVGEGQAYGLLAAAAVGDAKRFDRIWNWTKQHARRDDGLLVFRWAHGAVVDDQAATDADLDAAHALLVASCRFRRDDLRQEAERIGAAVLKHETARAAGQVVLLAGPWAAQSTRLVVNPSYLDPLTLTALARSTGNRRYAALADDGRHLVA
jgi:hypothetical protein